MSICKVCGADAGFMGVICSACSTKLSGELHPYKAQPTPPPYLEVDEDSELESELPKASMSLSDGTDDNSTEIMDEISEISPSAGPEVSGAFRFHGPMGGDEQADDRSSENEVESSTLRSSSWSSGKIAGRTFLILFLSGFAFGLFMAVVGHGIVDDNLNKGGGGLAVLFGWAFAGMGYFAMGVSVLALLSRP